MMNLKCVFQIIKEHCDGGSGLVFLLLFITLWGIRKAPRGKFFDNPLNRHQGQALRGLCAAVVVMHHLATCGCGLLSRFESFGALAVSVFFGLSGYGLMLQATSKADYFDGFWRKRLHRLWLPYLAVMVLAFAQWLRGDYAIVERLKWKFGIVQNGWFCGVLMLFYTVVWVCHRHNNGSKGEKLALTIAGVGVLTWGLATCWPVSTHVLSNGAFLVGLVFGTYQSSMFRMLQRYMYFFIAIMAVILALHLSSSAFYRFVLPSRLFFPRFIMGGFWFVGISVLSMKWQIGNRTLEWLGTISYELYLVHGWIIDEFRHWWPEWTGPGYAWTVVAASLLMAWGLHKALGHVNRHVEKS